LVTYASRSKGGFASGSANTRGMTDDSLIDEMRATIRADRERAEQRQAKDAPSAAAMSTALPEEAQLPEKEQQTAVDREPSRTRRRLRWLPRRRTHADLPTR